MIPFSNPVRQLWGHGQPSTASAPDLVANFDGMSDEHIHAQQTRGSNPQQPRQLAINKDGSGQLHIHYSGQVAKGLGDSSSGQYDDLTQQLPSRTVTAQPPGDHSRHFYAGANVQPFQSPEFASTASAECQVKQEPATDEHDDHDIFAEFTNGNYHNDNNSTSAETQQASHNSSNSNAQAPPKTPSIKTEHGNEKQRPNDAMEPAGTVESIATVGHSTVAAPPVTLDRTVVSSTHLPAAVIAERVLTSSSIDSETAPPTTQNPSATVEEVDASTQGRALTAFTGVPGAQYFSRHFAKDPQQQFVSPLAVLDAEKGQRSPSVDSVIASQRHSSEKTVSSSGGTNLEANLGLLAQWPQRQNLLHWGASSAEAVQANPVLLHGPMPIRQQQDQGASQGTAGAPTHQHNVFYSFKGDLPNHAQHAQGPQHSSNLIYSNDMQYTPYPVATQNGQLYPHWIPSGFAFNTLVPHASLPVYPLAQGHSSIGSTNPQPVTEAQEKEGAQASDDDEPLMSRAPRHHPTTAGPTASSDGQQPAKPSTSVKTPKNASRPSVSGGNKNCAIKLPDDDDDDEKATESISWKLPDFEATYHPPTTDRDLPMAKISTLGQKENLVREEVMLTEDHCQEEMQLFIDVFLPVQQALQAPDPAPAHAVINFHTIAVMVLETFVQYEIGDEFGRSDGSHSGNTADLPRRPGPSAADSEPTRTRSAKDADVDEIFFAVIDRWRAGMISGKETFKLIRGCQEFCDVALDVIHYVKEHGLLQPEPKKRKERRDKGVVRGPRGGTNGVETEIKATRKRKAEALESKASAKQGTKSGKVTTLPARKKTKVDVKNAKPKTIKSGVTVVNSRKK